MMPKVSVVTCSHNRPQLLAEAVMSMRQQTDQDWEHLIYDDASTDPQVEAVLAWAAEDSRVRVWRGKRNLDQPSILWNFMFDRANGRYFTVLDDDNQKLPNFVRRMSQILDDNSNFGIVTCGWRVDSPRGIEDYYLNLSTSSENLARGSTCDGGAMLYRREVFERVGYFTEGARTNEDWDWLRRAAATFVVHNLHEVHATYKSHDASRMKRCESLGNSDDVKRVQARQLAPQLGLSVFYPDYSRLTASQRDVCDVIKRSLGRIPFIKDGNDLALVVSPFQMAEEEIHIGLENCPRILTLHMEDPYALSANLAHIRALSKSKETWVCTNDAASTHFYREIVGDRTLVCPSLGVDDTIETTCENRDIDVLLCGYSYPSRQKFVKTLLPMLTDLRVMLVGDGWENYGQTGVETMPTQPLTTTYALHRRSRAVICLQRVHGDCSDGAVEPLTVNRGVLEGFSGSRVFLDHSRPRHSFDPGDIVWFGTPEELAKKIHFYLRFGETVQASNFQEKCALRYTYRTRLTRILNCIRSPRFLAEIP